MHDIKNDIDLENSNTDIIIIRKILEFLQIFVPITIAKRLIAIVLLVAGIPTLRVIELTGLCDRSTRELLKSMRKKDISELLSIKKGGGKKSKTSDIETEVIEEIEKNNYHTRQQIADMIKEKFSIEISVSSVGRLLKKMALKN